MYTFISFQAAVTAMHQLDFHHEFITIRMQTLQTHSFLLAICASIRSCPPSAVAKSIVMATKQDTYFHSRQVFQINECREKFSSLAASYGKLYRKSFDADPVTLHNIETYPCAYQYSRFPLGDLRESLTKSFFRFIFDTFP
jgi:integrator complex subunit 7